MLLKSGDLNEFINRGSGELCYFYFMYFLENS